MEAKLEGAELWRTVRWLLEYYSKEAVVLQETFQT